jgi:hypothetical protein
MAFEFGDAHLLRVCAAIDRGVLLGSWEKKYGITVYLDRDRHEWVVTAQGKVFADPVTAYAPSENLIAQVWLALQFNTRQETTNAPA